MPEATDRYTATRLSAELGLDNRKMRDILTRVNPVQVPAEEGLGQRRGVGVIHGLAELQRRVTLLDATKGRIDSPTASVA